MMEFSLGRYFADQPPPDLLFNAHPQPGGAYGQPIAPLSHGFHYDMDVPLPPSPQHPPSNTNRPVDHQHWKEHTLSSDTGISMTAPGAGSLSRVACTECRSRHLKCDAKTPRCSRCCDTGSICIYKKSRRGWKGPRRKDRPSSQEVRKPGQPLAVDLTHNFGTATHDISNNLVAPLNPYPTTTPILDTSQNYLGHLTSSLSPTTQHEAAGSIPADLLDLYYEHFHSAHPIVLPRAGLNEASREKDLTQLHAVIRYIGSVFSPSQSTPTFLEAANNALLVQAPPKNGFTVQALLLFAIALHSHAVDDRAFGILEHATDIALEIGMNKQEYAWVNGEDRQCWEESWRRTWWELYVMNGIFAAIHQRETFRLLHVECDVALPCEENDYIARIGNHSPHPLAQFQGRAFEGEDVIYSSFSYRIDAIRILGEVLAATGDGTDESHRRADTADASLTSWTFDLPKSKANVISEGGKVDEMLFQAHMIVDVCHIILHRPRSNLAFASVQGETACTRSIRYNVSLTDVDLHTTKAIGAANAISGLIKLPTPILNHTPLFTCAMAFSAIVHLTAYSLNSTSPEGLPTKGRIELCIGAVKQMRDVWAVASTVMQQIKAISREIFAYNKPGADASEGSESWTTTEEEISRLLEDDTIWQDGLNAYMVSAAEQDPFRSLLDSG